MPTAGITTASARGTTLTITEKHGRRDVITHRTKYVIALSDLSGDEKFLGGETWETKCWVEDIQQAMTYVHKWTAEEMCKLVEAEEDLDNCYVVDVLCSAPITMRGTLQSGKTD